MPYDDTLVVGYLRQTHSTTLLSEREKHLIGLAVTMTRGCQVCTRNRIEKRVQPASATTSSTHSCTSCPRSTPG